MTLMRLITIKYFNRLTALILTLEHACICACTVYTCVDVCSPKGGLSFKVRCLFLTWQGALPFNSASLQARLAPRYNPLGDSCLHVGKDWTPTVLILHHYQLPGQCCCYHMMLHRPDSQGRWMSEVAVERLVKAEMIQTQNVDKRKQGGIRSVGEQRLEPLS